MVGCVHDCDVREVLVFELCGELAKNANALFVADIIRQFANNAILDTTATTVLTMSSFGV